VEGGRRRLRDVEGEGRKRKHDGHQQSLDVAHLLNLGVVCQQSLDDD